MKIPQLMLLAILGILIAPITQAQVEPLLQGKLDLAHDTITLPLRQGKVADGRTVWFILTDTDNQTKARSLGIVYAPELANAVNAPSTRRATVDNDGRFTFEGGAVDFALARTVTPGMAPAFFPPAAARPGSVAVGDYSPFARDQQNTVYNAPILAVGDLSGCGAAVDHSKIHDKVVSWCPARHEVTLALSHGFAGGREVVYLSFDANVDVPAALEASTLAPAISDLTGTGSSLPLVALVNGEIGAMNPARQGLNSALHGDGSPLNILSGLPSAGAGYSPLWNVKMGEWTAGAIAQGKRRRLTSYADVLRAVKAGEITAPGGGSFASSGILVNCPVVALL